jgi:PTH1 family peptidyl-tRNA hydrolase
VRVGTGAKPQDWDLADWVLSRFSKDERAEVDDAIVRAAEAIETIVTDGIDTAMNRYNVK